MLVREQKAQLPNMFAFK
jgi:Retinoblastoma-associated protein A domain